MAMGEQPFSSPALFLALRTFVLTALAVLLALGGVVWERRELVWLVYPLWRSPPINSRYTIFVQNRRCRCSPLFPCSEPHLFFFLEFCRNERFLAEIPGFLLGVNLRG
jgi:hypothetical protein